MRKTLILTSALFALFATKASAEENPHKDQSKLDKLRLLKEAPSHYYHTQKNDDSTLIDAPFKPTIAVGSIVHMFGSVEQNGFGPGGASLQESASNWSKSFSVYRARILVGGQLSPKGSFFLETEIPAPPTFIGSANKNMGVAPRILDAQYEHLFDNRLQVVAGLMLVSHNRNGLQGAAGLMANDFTYFQYPYNMFQDSPLQGFLGRDVGVSARGFFLDDKLEYRLGLFSGRRAPHPNAPGFNAGAPLRTVGRVVYNFLDAEKDYYYAGTKLGKGKTFAWALGFDAQTTYMNIGTDVFVDVPLGESGSITLNSAFTYMSGGTDDPMENAYSFAYMIPSQTITHVELGYYFKKAKLQPWVRFESQAISADADQTMGAPVSDFNIANSSMVLGGGLNYFFNDYGTNLRLSYTTFNNDVMNTEGEFEKTSFGSLWFQLQFFLF